jgi:riboflavin kinase/FMN adenylyltransferase
MLCFRDIQAASENARRSSKRVATLGYFDALHLGHQKLLAELKGWAGEQRAEPAVVTFDPHPREVLGGKGPQRVLSLEYRLCLLQRAGVAATLVLPFTRELSLWSSEDFVRRVFVDALGARHVLLGFDSAFGHQRQGTYPYLCSKAAQLGVSFRQAPAEHLDGKRVSTTLVRQAIREGDLAGLERLLGRRFAVLGRVIRGQGRGKTLGFPTANIDVGGAALPPRGVYFAEVERRGSLGALGGAPGASTEESSSSERLGAVVNIGLRPTFEGQRGAASQETVEAYLVDFSGDLYGEVLEVHFLARHRDELRFPSVADLVEQIRRDVAAFREAWSTAGSER